MSVVKNIYFRVLIYLALIIAIESILNFAFKAWVVDSNYEPSVMYVALILKKIILIVATVMLFKREKIKIFNANNICKTYRYYWSLIVPFIFAFALSSFHLSDVLETALYKVILIFSLIFLSALFEELFFRALLINLFNNHIKKGNRILKITLTASFVFALVHVLNVSHYSFNYVLIQMYYAFCIGFLFSNLYIMYRHLLVLVVFHAVLNAFNFSKYLNITHERINYTFDFSAVLVILSLYTLIFLTGLYVYQKNLKK